MGELIETEHEAFPTPADKDIKIWRYMDLAKYLAVVQRQALFFPRASQLGDPFEGSATKPMVAMRDELLRGRRNVADAPFKDMDDSSLRTIFEQLARAYREMVPNYLVNCWHMNERESAAMWSVYTKAHEAVCIQSTYRRLRRELPQTVFIGEVKYVDYEIDHFPGGNLFYFIMHKRRSFEHERELRAIFWTMNGVPEAQPLKDRVEENGLWIDVDLHSLVETVCVSPSAAPWFAQVVQDATSKYGFRFPVKQSALVGSPLY